MGAVAGHGDEVVSITQARVGGSGGAFRWSLGLGVLGLLATALFYFLVGRSPPVLLVAVRCFCCAEQQYVASALSRSAGTATHWARSTKIRF